MKSVNDSVNQALLPLIPGRREHIRPVLVPIEVIQRITTMREAYRKCIEEGIRLGLVHSQDEVAAYLSMDATQFSRTLKEGGGRNLDDDKLSLLEQVCGNKIPSQWLAYQDGFELKQIESEVERENRELKEQINRMQQENEAIARFLRHTKSEV